MKTPEALQMGSALGPHRFSGSISVHIRRELVVHIRWPQNRIVPQEKAMQAILLYPDDQRIEAVVLSVGRYYMRVVPRDADDTIELVLRYGQWTDESGVPVEFDAFVVGDDNGIHNIAEMSEFRSAAP
jgi:hypothetical protein